MLYQIHRVAREVWDVDPGDMITLSQAAQLSGRSVATLAEMLNNGHLPWIQKEDTLGNPRTPRYTLRSAVEQLPAPKKYRITRIARVVKSR